ncbi:MAG TPA: ABC transporter ATP-binding protein [Acidimicrobiales bacterium]|jgi:oligopeptide/dipeptide ABC transporter ATP-binding protein|nr:ABC transporter ATP-binding protein [Acidimicrobiales bacterium]
MSDELMSSLSPIAAAHLLEVKDLSTGFWAPRGWTQSVDSASFVLDKGRTLGVVGESGAGKSVLARSIMGLAARQGAVHEGSVRFEGRELIGLPRKQLKALWGAEMAMVFQDPMTSLNPVMRIGRQITESLQAHLAMSKSQAKERAVELLRSVSLSLPEQRVDQYPHELSGGMRQRVVIAIALACDPQLLLADEPTTALDVTVQAQILDLLSEQQREREMAMILVTHDLGVIASMADEIIVMYAGQIVEQAPAKILFGSPRMPYTEALIQSIPKLDQPSHAHLRVIPGAPPDPTDMPSGCRFAPRCSYVQERCLVEAPGLSAAKTPGHVYRCWFPLPEQSTTIKASAHAGNAGS